MPASRSAIADSWATSGARELAVLLGLDVEDADDLVVPGERHRQHRGDEPALVDAPDPQEAGVGGDVGDDHRLAHRGDPAGDPLAERHDRAPDLEPVEAVRRGEGQAAPVAVEQVQRRDAGVERVARPVDDGLEQLLPGLGGRREAEQAVQEPQLRDGVVRAPGRPAGGGREGGCRSVLEVGHQGHLTSLGGAATEVGCDPVPGRCPCSRTVTIRGWHEPPRSPIL